jgi:HSP20 family protein
MASKEHAITRPRQESRLDRPRASGSSGNPFSTLQRLADEMDHMFGDFGFGPHRAMSPFWRTAGAGMWAPEVEVYQKNDQLFIKADLPGLEKNDVSVDVMENSVTIQGERKSEREEEHEGLFRSERSYGSFRRVIPLPEGALTDQAKASFRNGVLEITMPAPPASRGRRLDIAGEVRK